MMKEVITACENGHNLLILGSAGTGKSHLVKKIERLTSNAKKMEVIKSGSNPSKSFVLPSVTGIMLQYFLISTTFMINKPL
jgi:energy-coupling factor transporter ATP-binding protein EcfA2